MGGGGSGHIPGGHLGRALCDVRLLLLPEAAAQTRGAATPGTISGYWYVRVHLKL